MSEIIVSVFDLRAPGRRGGGGRRADGGDGKGVYVWWCKVLGEWNSLVSVEFFPFFFFFFFFLFSGGGPGRGGWALRAFLSPRKVVGLFLLGETAPPRAFRQEEVYVLAVYGDGQNDGVS